MDVDGYPEKEEFDILDNLDIDNVVNSFSALLKLFRACGSGSGKMYTYRSDVTRKDEWALDLHTGGWSGCETLIDYLQQKCFIFWTMYWYSETRGGHYTFKAR
jgi:hypothetical protein